MRKAVLVDVEGVWYIDTHSSRGAGVGERDITGQGRELLDTRVICRVTSYVDGSTNRRVSGEREPGQRRKDIEVCRAVLVACSGFVEERCFAEIELSCNFLLLFFCQSVPHDCWDADDGQWIAHIGSCCEDIYSGE